MSRRTGTIGGLLLLALVPVPNCTTGGTEIRWTIYTDSLRAFSVAVPFSWQVVPADYNFAHYLWVFLSVNNQVPAFNLTDTLAPGEEYGSFLGMAARRLKPGMVYVSFAHGEGPASVAHYGEGREYSFASELAKLLQRTHPLHETEDLDFDQLDFVKWGTGWHVFLYCRRPYSTRDRGLAIEMIKSLQFQELPIVNGSQAVGVALHHLPREAEPEGEWPAVSARSGRYETEIERRGTAFFVKFVRYATGVSDKVIGKWMYLVRSDGSADAQPERPNVLQPSAPRDGHK